MQLPQGQEYPYLPVLAPVLPELNPIENLQRHLNVLIAERAPAYLAELLLKGMGLTSY